MTVSRICMDYVLLFSTKVDFKNLLYPKWAKIEKMPKKENCLVSRHSFIYTCDSGIISLKQWDPKIGILAVKSTMAYSSPFQRISIEAGIQKLWLFWKINLKFSNLTGLTCKKTLLELNLHISTFSSLFGYISTNCKLKVYATLLKAWNLANYWLAWTWHFCCK